MKDHLGSIRQTLSESGAVQSAMDYYAFGGTFSSYVVGSTVDKYKFTGKERDTETGLDYFGARYFDSKVGHWMSVDPLAEKCPGLSPYNYCLNNPLKLSDPDGNEPIDKSDKPKLSNEQKQKLAKAEAQFTVDLFKSVGKSAGEIFAENVAPTHLTASEFGQGAGLALTGSGALTSEVGGEALIGLGLAVSTWSSYVHGGTTFLVGAIEGNSSKMTTGFAEVSLTAITGGLGSQIEKLSSLAPVAQKYLQATMDWSGTFLNFGISNYISAKDKKQAQQKKVTTRKQDKEE